MCPLVNTLINDQARRPRSGGACRRYSYTAVPLPLLSLMYDSFMTHFIYITDLIWTLLFKQSPAAMLYLYLHLVPFGCFLLLHTAGLTAAAPSIGFLPPGDVQELRDVLQSSDLSSEGNVSQALTATSDTVPASGQGNCTTAVSLIPRGE